MVDDARHFRFHLPKYSGSYAYLSEINDVDTAVVFVHGFGGDAVKTWYNFQGLIDSANFRKDWLRCDLFFFQYKSVWGHIEASSFLFQGLLDDIYPEPNEELFTVELKSAGLGLAALSDPTLSVLPSPRHYKQIVLVGHSEGAVVIRRTLLSMVQGVARAAAGDQTLGYGESQASAVKPSVPPEGTLRLFAPALFGYRPSGFPGVLARAPFVGRFVDWVLMSTSPAYQDLTDPNGLLSYLQKETELLAPAHAILRANILWGTEERVLKTSPGKYRDDPIVDWIDGATHTSICKPSATFPFPLRFCRP